MARQAEIEVVEWRGVKCWRCGSIRLRYERSVMVGSRPAKRRVCRCCGAKCDVLEPQVGGLGVVHEGGKDEGGRMKDEGVGKKKGRKGVVKG